MTKTLDIYIRANVKVVEGRKLYEGSYKTSQGLCSEYKISTLKEPKTLKLLFYCELGEGFHPDVVDYILWQARKGVGSSLYEWWAKPLPETSVNNDRDYRIILEEMSPEYAFLVCIDAEKAVTIERKALNVKNYCKELTLSQLVDLIQGFMDRPHTTEHPIHRAVEGYTTVRLRLFSRGERIQRSWRAICSRDTVKAIDYLMKTTVVASRWIAQSGEWLRQTAAYAEQSITELTSASISAYSFQPRDFGQPLPTTTASIQRSDTRNSPQSRGTNRGCWSPFS